MKLNFTLVSFMPSFIFALGLSTLVLLAHPAPRERWVRTLLAGQPEAWQRSVALAETQFAFSETGENTVRVLDQQSGSVLWEIPDADAILHHIGFSPDAALLFTRGLINHDGNLSEAVNLWDTSTHDLVHRWPLDDDVYFDIAFSPLDAPRPLIAVNLPHWSGSAPYHYDNDIEIMDAATLEIVTQMTMPHTLVTNVALGHNANDAVLLAAGGVRTNDDEQYGTLWLWQLDSDGTLTPSLEYDLGVYVHTIRSIDISPDGQQMVFVAVSGDRCAGLRSETFMLDIAESAADSALIELPARRYPVSAVFSPDGSQLALNFANARCFEQAGGTVELYDLTTGTITDILPHDFTVSALRFSDDGRYLYTAMTNGAVQIWNVE
jgi:WD40 repeat protein